MRRRWVALLLLSLLFLTGCSARKASTAADPPGAHGQLKSAGTTTQQGTVHYLREVSFQADGKVREVRTIEATDRFAQALSASFDSIAQGSPDYRYTQSELDGVLRVRGERIHDSLAAFNQAGIASMQLMDWPLYRTLRFDSQVGPLDDDTIVQMFPVKSGVDRDEWITFLHDAIRVSFVLTDEATGNTYRWSRTAGQIGSGTTVSMTGKEWHPLALYLSLAVGAVLLGVIYLGLFGRRHWDQTT